MTETVDTRVACDTFIEHSAKFKWFLDKYFGKKQLPMMLKLAEAGEESKLISTCIVVWERLPDRTFNIIVNPKGWPEFLSVIDG
jgi:hypothetical protein